jgi:polygalacturonase/sugar lactone lactonase YvrE
MLLPLRSLRITALLLAFTAFAITTALGQAPAVATGDTRTVVEPTFPATCQSLPATFHDANEDVPASAEATSTNPDQSRLQTALNACTGSNQAVELTQDASGNNAFLTGPISIPSGVTLLVDPGVTLYFSRNAQDYDTVQGTHTCGTVNAASNTASCQNLITVKNTNNSAIMGYGKLNGRGGDVVLNSFPTAGYESSTTGKSWWDLANDANGDGGSQQNPRGIQISNSTNFTFYKITFQNSPNFHVALSGVTGFTVWDMKIITPYTARNTDGIDPSGTVNATITKSWISDGDDNIAIGGSGAASQNISVINNHFYAGHGESIGSITTNGVSNILFDSNAMYGDADVDGSNSTAIRIKSANDRGGLVTNIQYSNSCFVNHGTQMQFTPLYNTNTGTLTPNFKNILLQNLRFSNQGAVATGSVTFLGASNNGTVNPLIVTMDNVTVDTLASTNLIAPSNAQITYGPGPVSSTLTTLLAPYNGVSGNVIADNRTAYAPAAPSCNFTFLAPELTGPQGFNQTVTSGQYPTAVVILSPTFNSTSYPYPTGTVTLTDEASRTFTATLSGTGDTTFIPITNAPTGTHTYTASYSGNSQYPAIASFGNYTVTVGGGSLPSTTTTLSSVPSATTYGAGFTAVASVTGSSPSGSVSFLVNGATYATAPLAAGSASYTFNLPLGSYSISAVYNGDSANAGSASSATTVAIGGAATATTLTGTATTGVVGTPVPFTATVTSAAGAPTGTVSFSYTISGGSSTATVIGAAPLSNGVAAYSALLPQGVDSVSATYIASGNFSGSSSSPAVVITVSAAPPVPISAAPVAMPLIMSTIVGGGASATTNGTCTGHVDSFGDGCLGTSIYIPATTDLRGVTIDPFGNVYFTDANALMVRKIAPSGIVTDFAGWISGTSCAPSPTVGCAPGLVKLSSKPRGVFADNLGNIFVAGYGADVVWEIKVTDGKMYTVAGTGSAGTPTGTNGDGGLATVALLNQPRSAATDSAGNLYIADTADFKIRKVLAGTGAISTIAGTGVSSSTGDGALATAATLANPQGVLTDAGGNVYIAETTKVRAVCVTCASGSGLYNLLVKLGVTTPTNGNIYTVAGTTTATNTSLTTSALANTVNMGPQKLGLDTDGNLYIADSSNNVVWFVDGRSGFARVIAGGGTATSCSTSAIGDGCRATQAIAGSNGGNGYSTAIDSMGNLYIGDSTNGRIRKVSSDLHFASTAAGSTTTQNVELHFTPGDTPSSTTLSSSDFALGTPTCTTNTDTTTDCVYSTTFSPKVAGNRSQTLGVATALNNPVNFTLSGLGLGAGATVDPASQLTFGTNLIVNATAIDNAGNVYVADGVSKSVLKFAPGAAGIGAGAAAASTKLGTFDSPSAVAVDSLGNVYVADTSTSLITQIAPAGTTRTLSGFTSPDGLAVDSLNNLYVSDSSAKTVTEVGSNFTAKRILLSSGLASPAGLATDSNGNIFVTDPTVSTVFRIDSQTSALTTASTAAVAPKAVAVDAAENLLIADSASGSIIAVPSNTSSTSFTVASSLAANALALDATGDIYTASSGGQVLELERTQGLTTFTRASNAPIPVNLLSTGNVAATLTSTDPDQTDFALTLTPSTNCTTTSTTIGVAVGGSCQFTSSFTPSSATNFFNTVTFAGNIANAPLTIMQTGMNAPYPVTVTVGSLAPATPTYGQSATVAATVTSIDGSPTGTVQFKVDNVNFGTPLTLNAGAAMTTLTGLTGGAHVIGAAYSGDSSFAATTGQLNATVAKQASSTAVKVSSTSINPGVSVTFTATVTAATSGTPTGTVTFFDGTTSLGNGTLSGAGVTTFATTTLLSGSHSITATYNGDTNFLTSSGSAASTPITVAPLDFTLSYIGSTQSSAGASVVSLSVSPLYGTYPGVVSFTATGGPANATYTFSPATVAANGGITAVTLTVAGTASASNISPRNVAPFALALLLLPFAGRWRKSASRMKHLLAVALLLIGSAVLFTSITGCGTSTTQSRLFILNITATSGTVQHSVVGTASLNN